MASAPGPDGAPAPRPPAGHRRIGHKKSRNGCARCKARHVKCDEQAPCRNCVRHDLECSLVTGGAPVAASSPAGSAQNHHSPGFPTPLSRGLDHHTTPSASSRASPASQAPSSQAYSHKHTPTPSRPSTLAGGNGYPDVLCSDEPQGIYTPHWMQSVRLFHHFCQHTAFDMSSSSATTDLWRKRVPDVACSYEFLMHGLLACSALHYARTHPAQSDEYILVSTHYQTLALQFFTNRLSDISEDNVEAYFLLATFIFMLAIASISDPQAREKRSADPKDLAQSFLLLHGIKGILDVKAAEKLGQHDGPLAAMLHSREFLSRPIGTKKSSFTRRLDQLITLVRELDSSIFFDVVNNPQTACILALESLRHTYYACADVSNGASPTSTATAAMGLRMRQQQDAARGGGGRGSSPYPHHEHNQYDSPAGMQGSPAASSNGGFQSADERALAEHGQRFTWLWPLTLTPVFMQLVGSGNHMALIIVAHYAALARGYEGPFWVTKGWSQSVLAIVQDHLHPDKHRWIAWPRRSIMEEIYVDDMPDDHE
ncbi:hypothetical protein Micbo1qcDRAFT_46711 [Microdochium bolleyi]|uniref:Zn(2)-C6 fungal-type domain-containing protein n=1 Tax=Microdochium bolleyi TaxID=196109 RepID=A0A136JCG0_9PEZI|nr:hypothetical protein Micbo1qcDRAFT_46711 [Microdochium bolleyi]